MTSSSSIAPTPVVATRRARGRPTARTRALLWPYLLVSPAIAALILFIYFPLYKGTRLSLTNLSLLRPASGTWIGLDNYVAALTSHRFWQIGFQTVVWSVVSVAGSVIVGMAAALLLHGPIFGRSVWRGLLLVPWVAPPVVSAFIWGYLYRDTGPLLTLLERIGILSHPVSPLYDASISFARVSLPLWSVIQLGVWSGFSFIFIGALAALAAVPRDLYDAAALDGAGPVRAFWQITLPLISPVLETNITLLVLWRFAGFDLPFLLTQGGPKDASNVLGVYIYNTGFISFNFGFGAALGLSLFAMLAPISFVYVLRSRRKLLGR